MGPKRMREPRTDRWPTILYLRRVRSLFEAWFGNIARVLEPGVGFYIWGGFSKHRKLSQRSWKANGLYFSAAIIWDKNATQSWSGKLFNGRSRMGVLAVWRERAGPQYFGPAQPNRPLERQEDPARNNLKHLTGKQRELAVKAMQYSVLRHGDNVAMIWSCGGSGIRPLIAAGQTRTQSVPDGTSIRVL